MSFFFSLTINSFLFSICYIKLFFFCVYIPFKYKYIAIKLSRMRKKDFFCDQIRCEEEWKIKTINFSVPLLILIALTTKTAQFFNGLYDWWLPRSCTTIRIRQSTDKIRHSLDFLIEAFCVFPIRGFVRKKYEFKNSNNISTFDWKVC